MASNSTDSTNERDTMNDHYKAPRHEVQDSIRVITAELNRVINLADPLQTMTAVDWDVYFKAQDVYLAMLKLDGVMTDRLLAEVDDLLAEGV
tara:strand:+ start:483 stop:758 length:276 start_codon:yes stop_codon:yes gene_type:complete